MEPFTSPVTPPPAPTYGVPGPPPAPEEAAPAPRVERRPMWLAVTTAATGAALIASLLTASLTGAFTPTDIASSETSAPAATTPLAHHANVEGVDWQQVAATVRPYVVAITARTQQEVGRASCRERVQ